VLEAAQTFEAELLSCGGLLLQNYPFDVLETILQKVSPYQNSVTKKGGKTADEATNMSIDTFLSIPMYQ
jgi:hypothetical protein